MTEHPRDDELRALFEDAVSDVDPPPALQHIQSRTQSPSQSKVVPMNRKRPWIFAAAGAVAATAATLVLVTTLTDDDPVNTSGPASSPSASATAEESEEAESTTEPTPTDDSTPDPSPSSPASRAVALPVYYVGSTPAGPRLFREFHRESVQDDELVKAAWALELAITGRAVLDPDYASDWPEGTTLGSVSYAHSTPGNAGGPLILVDLRGDVGGRPAGMSEDEATMAVQQLVYTAQAALQQRAPVEFQVDGKSVDTLLGVPVAEQAVAGDPSEVQAPVWIISPQESEAVGRTFTVEGRGAFFEANVSWQLLQDGEVADEGFATAEQGMTLSPYSFEVTAEPGDYTLRVYDADMSGGEGNGEAEDTKFITVE